MTGYRAQKRSGVILASVAALVAAFTLGVSQQSASSHPAIGKSCHDGSDTEFVTANQPGAHVKRWRSTASHLRQQRTTCSKAEAIASAITLKSCGECKPVHRMNGYAVKEEKVPDRAYTLVTATKNSAIVTFHLVTRPA